MDLNTIEEIARPVRSGGAIDWREGDAWLAGGTWLFSEPQPHLRRLIDLQGLGWKSLATNADGLEIGATCTIAELFALKAPAEWTAAPVIDQCCRSFLSSFKIWNTATVGGNICMSLPAGPMISMATALEAICTIQQPAGGERKVAIEDFVIGNHRNVLKPGELLRRIDLPGRGFAQTIRLSPDFSDSSGPLGGAAGRHSRSGRRNFHADRLGVDGAAAKNQVRKNS